jgi:di/tricarboxylate transporter
VSDLVTALAILGKDANPFVVLSVLVTALHTADEIISGPIWDYLARLTGLPRWLLLPAYLAFQTALVALAVIGLGHGERLAAVALLVARLMDVLVTHGLLRVLVKDGNPGSASAPLLVIDVGLILAGGAG